MNNDFIQELKEKRERYGVSQSRLAVACGISREYYNRIENGKTQLTEALKEEIQKHIERFNQEEPLFLLIDYFRVRFPTTDALTVIQSVMHLKEKYVLHEDYGKYGYEESYLLGDIQVMVSHNEVLGVLMEMKGKGCRQMESYLLAQERSWYDFMLDCLTAGGVVKRLDLAVNDRVGILNIPKLIEKWERGEAVTRRPDFICDPVPENFRQRFEGRKGKNRSLAILLVVLFLFAASVLDAILFAAGDQYAALGGSRGYAFLTALLKGTLSTAVFTILPLAGAVKWHSSMTGKLYAAKIRKYETGWFAGFFTADCLVTEDKKGHRSTWYYNDIVSVEEDGGSFRVRGEGGELLIPKMYLKRDSVRSVRNHLCRYCADVYRQDFVEEEEGISLVLSGQEASEDAVRRQGEIHRDYVDYAKNSTSFYYTETRLWVIGACTAYLIRCALSGSGSLSGIAGIGILAIALCIPVLTGLKNMAARRTVRARDRRMKAGIPTELKIGKGGVLLRSGQEIRQSWDQIRRILEGQGYFVIGRIYLSKKSLTEEEAGQVRALCQKYAGRKYIYVEMEPQKAGEVFRTFLPLLCFAVFTAAVTAVENGVAFYQAEGRSAGTWSDGMWGADRGNAAGSGTDGTDADGKTAGKAADGAAGSGEQGSREPVYVTTPDKAALHLNASEIRIDECYSNNEVNYSSRFFIDSNGTLYGASANEHGELGNGTTEADIRAKGFYREVEVARDVCHVSLGKEFMVYLTDSGVLMGTGNLPAEDNPIVTTAALELMSDVQYVKCSPYGMIVLKTDGTVWCAGRLCDGDGNVIREYDGFEQVMDHAVYADAGERTMAVIRSDGSLWMWGDNSSQQCGVDSRVAEKFTEPTQVRGNVRMVWLDRLSFYDEQEYQGYLENASDPQEQYSSNVFRTYILQDDGQVYACGQEGTFVKVTVIEG